VYDDGSIRAWPRMDRAERERLELTHEPRTVDGREVFIPREPEGDDA
jgi:hypothetical protein